jgi:hypothetical protein
MHVGKVGSHFKFIMNFTANRKVSDKALEDLKPNVKFNNSNGYSFEMQLIQSPKTSLYTSYAYSTGLSQGYSDFGIEVEV